MDLPTAIAQSCDTYFYRLGNKFYLLPTDRGQPIQRWAAHVRLRPDERRSDLTPQATGLVPTIGWKHPTMFTKRRPIRTGRSTSLWKPGDSINARDRPGRPDRDTAPDGPLLRGDRERRQARHAARPDGRREPEQDDRADRRAAGAEADSGTRIRRTSTSSSRGSSRARTIPSARRTACSATSRWRSPARPGTAQKVVHLPGHHTGRGETSRGGAAMVPANDAKIVVCAVIENGGEGGAAAAPAAERVFAKFFHVHADATGIHQLRLMLEYAGSQRAGLRASARRRICLPSCAPSTGSCVAGVAALVVVGLWGVAGVTKFDVPSDPSYYLNRQILYACVGGRRARRRGADRSGSLPPLLARDLRRHRAWSIAFVLLVGHAAHGSTRWISLGFFTFQPSEFGKLLFVLALAGMLAERQRDLSQWGTTLRVLGLGARAGAARLRPARPRHRARLHGRARGDAVRRRDAVAAPRRARRGRRAPRRRRPLGRPCGRRQFLKGYQQAAPDVLHPSVDVSRPRRATT